MASEAGKTARIQDRSADGLVVFASPMMTDDMAKNCLKLVKKATKAKRIRRGCKEVLKAFRNNEGGVLLLAANVTPPDIIAHLPVLCEQKSVPYIFHKSKEELGAAAGTKRPTSVLLVRPITEGKYADLYKSVHRELSTLGATI